FEFYSGQFGWTKGEAMDMGPMGKYQLFAAGGDPIGGMMNKPDAVPSPGWLGYILADDVDAATEAVRQAGGKVHRLPADIPDVGRFSVVADPQGAMFMLFKPSGGDNPPAPPMTPGHVGWRELYTSDWEQAFEFYAGQFGWTKAEAIDMGPMGKYQLFAAGGDPIGGMMNKPDAIPSPAWLFYFAVPAIDAAAARVTEKGGQVLNGPMEVPGGSWIVQCMDPQGAAFALVAPQR
ncbi:MAG TPA: VOC family protein, partial [Propylenella sp.]|nr:VOC family protein [Propylenella sp.]